VTPRRGVPVKAFALFCVRCDRFIAAPMLRDTAKSAWETGFKDEFEKHFVYTEQDNIPERPMFCNPDVVPFLSKRPPKRIPDKALCHERSLAGNVCVRRKKHGGRHEARVPKKGEPGTVTLVSW
jgi:hypothetical protein